VSSATAHRAGAAGRRRSPRRRTSRRRRPLTLAVALAVVATAAALLLGPLKDVVREVTLPLRHDDIIRQQARAKGLDPSLIAAVIYEESKFRDQTSHAGARGLMQITPETARFIARRSGGTEFVQKDLATPQINISYGAFYLRYLMDRYGGKEELAVAAYNAGETNVDKWLRRAGGATGFDPASDIPFPETRVYVSGVVKHRKEYREHYSDELGL
jgi:soluble lytic murein transglycosylase